ncbi:hypothetical protein Ahy_A07g032811 isoform H [Arachis hypogaea]|uniref:Uncharacterized protein n=1 Tax=Arachis hypogaea TaxID=3818 RepID=A0A445C7N0_ARAHY|nr:hypothetical protein Ahy_A07g032811 isoform H [Arachis hypogaea]
MRLPQFVSTSSKPPAHIRPATAAVPTSSFEGNGATSVQPPPFELRKSKPPSPVSPLASVAQPLPAGASSVPHHHVSHCLPSHCPQPLPHPRQLCPVPAFQDPASSLAVIGAIHTTTLAKLSAKRQEVLSPAGNIVEQGTG